MKIHHYETSDRKDLILEYIDNLNKDETTDALSVLKNLEDDNTDGLIITPWQS